MNYTKNPLKITRYKKKCFAGIRSGHTWYTIQNLLRTAFIKFIEVFFQRHVCILKESKLSNLYF